MSHQLKAEQIKIVLVETMGAANIGAIARSMTTFGVSRLVLVAPQAQVNQNSYNWACHGKEVLDAVETVATLAEALSDSTLVLGLTRRQGKRRHRLIPLAEFAESYLPGYLPANLALVFGNEESGLSNQDLDLCHRRVFIPTLPECGSMNLGHAVTATLYELLGRAAVGSESETELASPEDHLILIREAQDMLAGFGYPQHRATMAEEMTKLSDLVGRRGLEQWEFRFLMGILAQVRYSLSEKSNDSN